MAVKKRGLGKGLDAIYSDNSTETGDKSIKLRLAEIEPNRDQPRKAFDEEALNELADSIRAVGVIQPLIVRPLTGGTYQIVAGERRWRASKIAGLEEVPAVIRELTDREVAEFALIENLQREDLDPIEEAEGYKYLINEYSLTQEQVAERVGKSRPAISNAIRLLELPEKAMDLLKAGKLSVGHVRALLSLSSQEEMAQLAADAAKRSMTVRDVEKAVKARKEGKTRTKKDPIQRDSMLDEVELALSAALQRRVKVSGSKEKGVLEVDFFSIEELMDMANRLSGDIDLHNN